MTYTTHNFEFTLRWSHVIHWVVRCTRTTFTHVLRVQPNFLTQYPLSIRSKPITVASKIYCKHPLETIYKKAVLSQRWPRNAPYTFVPWKISGLPDYAHGYNCQHFSWAFVQIDPMNVPTKFEFCSFTRSWDNRRYPKKWAVPGYAHASFSPKFLMGFYFDLPCKCTCQIWRP